MISPKGKYRMWQPLVIAVPFLFLVLYFGSSQYENAWFYDHLNNITQMSTGLFAMYYSTRWFLHKRMHELDEVNQRKRELVVIASIAFVVGCALI